LETKALILTYHGIGPGPRPLSVDPGLFAEQLDCLLSCGAKPMTVSALGARLATGDLPGPAVAITFDDGLLSVAETAAPMLTERGMTATIFCVAGRLGGEDRWPDARSGGPYRPLAGPGALRELAAAGFEIGAHGMQHRALRGASPAELRSEVVEARDALEQQLQISVDSFAYPYGALPDRPGRALIRSTYAFACTTRSGYATQACEPSALPRVDIHYLSRTALLTRALQGTLDGYLAVRRRAAWVRRVAVKDYARPAA
jgi:peptidoglycan/xylan/chitin deacetylase (PgdA/CDA1 family)